MCLDELLKHFQKYEAICNYELHQSSYLCFSDFFLIRSLEQAQFIR